MADVLSTLAPYVVAVVTLAILSFAWRENKAYALVEHIMVGAAIGHVAATGVNYLRSTMVQSVTGGNLTLVVPLVIGLFVYMRFVKAGRWSNWLSLIPIGVILGTAAGLFLPTEIVVSFVAQIRSTMLSILNFNNAVIIAGFVSTMSYFIFTWQQNRGIGRYLFYYPGKLGRWFIMVYLGATFTLYAISRLNMLIGAVQPTLDPPAVYLAPIAVAMIVVSIVRERGKKRESQST
ncbi:MAG: hypothetical protein ABSD41_10195 [Candidatus Bathyarchaeia archaeon]|jgi:hypothetical protein